MELLILAVSGAALACWLRFSCALILIATVPEVPPRILHLAQRGGRYAHRLLDREYRRQAGIRGSASWDDLAERVILMLNFQFLRLRCRAIGPFRPRRRRQAIEEMTLIVGGFALRNVNSAC